MKDDRLISLNAAIETVRKAKSIGQAHRMLVQLPSAQSSVSKEEMVGDAISRQAAIDAFAPYAEYESNRTNAEWVRRINMVLSALPSAQQWIPCSERFPKPNEYEDGVRKYYLVQNEYGDMMVCSWDGRGWMRMYRHTYVEDKVVAWMPLPKMWEGEVHE